MHSRTLRPRPEGNMSPPKDKLTLREVSATNPRDSTHDSFRLLLRRASRKYQVPSLAPLGRTPWLTTSSGPIVGNETTVASLTTARVGEGFVCGLCWSSIPPNLAFVAPAVGSAVSRRESTSELL